MNENKAMKAMTTDSMAGTGEKYVIIQARIAGNQLKFQGVGPNVNRDYGVSDVCPIDCATDLAAFVRTASQK